MEVKVPETRGRNPVYHFYNMQVGEERTYDKDNSIILRCAQMQMQSRELDWRFRTYTNKDGKTVIVRIS